MVTALICIGTVVGIVVLAFIVIWFKALMDWGKSG